MVTVMTIPVQAEQLAAPQGEWISQWILKIVPLGPTNGWVAGNVVKSTLLQVPLPLPSSM